MEASQTFKSGRIADSSFRDLRDVRVRRGVSGRVITTIGLGGTVDLLLEIETMDALTQCIRRLLELRLTWRILGAGSNLLIQDDGVLEPVISLGKEFRKALLVPENGGIDITSIAGYGLQFESSEFLAHLSQVGAPVRIFAFAAYPLMRLSRELTKFGLHGLEFAAGIPASLGGAVAMNAGAHGSCIANILRTVHVVLSSGEYRVFPVSELSCSYRRTYLPERAIVVGAELELTVNDPATTAEERNRCLSYRKQTQPLHLPSAGSVFRNPSQELAAATLLEQAGLKGYRLGGVGYSPLHANWIVRDDENAAAGHVLALIEEGRVRVKEQSDIVLHPELVIW